MLFECEQPFVGEEGCVTRQKRLRGRIGDPGKLDSAFHRINYSTVDKC